MALFKNIFSRISSGGGKLSTRKREAEEKPMVTVTVPSAGTNEATQVNRKVSPHTAMCVATAYRCVRLLCESVAQLPLRIMERRGAIFIPAGGSASWLLEAEPCPGWNAFDYWAQIVADVLLTGNAYIKPQYIGPELSALQILNPYSVGYDPDVRIYDVCDLASGVQGRFTDSEIIHIKGLGSVRGRGMSVLGYAAAGINVARQGDAETFRRFKNGGIVRGILTSPDGAQTGGLDWYDDRELDRLARDMNILAAEGQGIIPVYGAAKFTPNTFSSTDLQFLETRKFTVREICRFFGVHPSFVFDDTSNNYKSAEMANVAFLSNTLNPLLRKIEIEITRKLVGSPGFGRIRFEFDRHSLYTCDLSGRAAFLKSKLETGSSVNEVRRLENLPPVEGGDAPLVSANLKTFDQLNNEKGNIQL